MRNRPPLVLHLARKLLGATGYLPAQLLFAGDVLDVDDGTVRVTAVSSRWRVGPTVWGAYLDVDGQPLVGRTEGVVTPAPSMVPITQWGRAVPVDLAGHRQDDGREKG